MKEKIIGIDYAKAAEAKPKKAGGAKPTKTTKTR